MKIQATQSKLKIAQSNWQLTTLGLFLSLLLLRLI